MATDLMARDSADLARRLASYRFRGVPKAGFLGDSLSQFGKNVTATQIDWTNSSYIPWLRRLLRDRMQTTTALNFGVASQKTDHFLNIQVPQAIAAGIDIAFVQIGTNDIASFTLAQSIANVTAGIGQLNAAGIAVVLISIAPQSGWGSGSRQQAAAYNQFLHGLARDRSRNVRFIDINPVYMDYGTGNAITGCQFSDNVHDSPVGALIKANLIFAAIDDLFPKSAELLTASALAQFDAVLAARGNLLTNGLVAGTGGRMAASPAGISGNTADNWNLAYNNSSGTTTFTGAASKGADASNVTIPTQVITLGGTGDSFYLRLRAQSVDNVNGVTIPAGIGAGDSLVLTADIKWSGLAGIKMVLVRLECSDGTTMTVVRDGGEFVPSGTSSLPLPATFAGLFVTDPLILPTGVTSLHASIEIVPISGAPVAGAVTVSRIGLRKI